MARHLAQLNIAWMRGSIDDPVMADFVGAIDSVHKLAGRSPGFVRIVPDNGYQPWGDPKALPNLTVWEDINSLRDFTYRSAHGNLFSKRDKWFVSPGRAHMALWWFDDTGDGPDYDDAIRRLDHLQQNGPSPEAFTFGQPYDVDGVPLGMPSENRMKTDVD
ncbi:conserved hypothetical protein [Maricaulis maris MCS10]|uniref:DUF3291 domain-containing protein n=1 Tax=Maricaulis maris (strain MCS10) TaxID=394221 RepID=Q0APS8_MARMM|nr:DUF3291 domain-containing protein [Maricaulis maris]ABI65709.1 conserved hypothetical protein [Maricaulis maris MCS10]